MLKQIDKISQLFCKANPEVSWAQPRDLVFHFNSKFFMSKLSLWRNAAKLGSQFTREFATLPKSMSVLGIGLEGSMGSSVINPNLHFLQSRGDTFHILGNSVKLPRKDGIKCFYANSDNRAERMPQKGLVYDLIIYSAKPDQIDALLGKCAENGNIGENTAVASVAAGVTKAGIKRACKNLTDQIIRLMPNKLADVEMSATTYTTSGSVEEDKLDYILALFSKVGKTFAAEESEMNKNTALAGSGPASPWSIYKIMQEALRVNCGLSDEESRGLIIKVAKEFDDLKYEVRSGSKVDEALKHVRGGSMKTARAMIDASAKGLGSEHAQEEREQLVAGILMQVRGSKIRGAASIGIDPAMAGSIVRDLIVGTAIASERSGEDFAVSAESVTSRNGTTRALLGHLLCDKGDGKGHDFDDIYARGMQAAVQRGAEMGDSVQYAANKFAQELSANEKSPEKIEAARGAVVVAYNQARSALKLTATEKSVNDSSVTQRQISSLQNPEGSKLDHREKSIEK